MSDFQIEQDILVKLLENPKEMDKIVIQEDYFLNPINKFIFKLFKKQYEDFKTINLVGIAENYMQLFNEKYKYKDIMQIISNYLTTSAVSIDLNYYQEVMFERFIKTNILKAIEQYHQQKISTDELLNEIHKNESRSIRLKQDQLNSDEIFSLISSKNKTIEFRFSKLAKYANIQEHDLVVVAARPGVGKTGFILNLIEDISDKYLCLYFNMEMSQKQVYQRLVAINASVPMKYHDNPETEYQKNVIKKGCENIASKKIKVINSSQSINSIRRKIINESKNEHIIAFIDYVGLISSSEPKKNLYEKITSIVKELRRITLDYDCTIFLVSQINRNSENQKDKMPKISDLKESGELEQSSTTVLILYDEKNEQKSSKEVIEMSIIIGKNRNGQVGKIPIKYDRSTQKYDDIRKEFNEPNGWRKNERKNKL